MHEDDKTPLHLEIAALSFAGLVLEIAYTRVFSFKLFYYFTYVIIGIGLLGLGAGGVLVAVVRRLREAGPAAILRFLCPIGGVSVLAGYWVIAPLPLNISALDTRPLELPKLVLSCMLLTVPFLVIGIGIASILGARTRSIGSLYAADLAGAALGCTLSIPLVVWLDPPRTVVLAGAVLALAGLRVARPSRRAFVALFVLSGALLVPAVTGRTLADPVGDEGKQYEMYRQAGLLRHFQWSPVFRIDVLEHAIAPGEAFIVYHDGLPGSGLRRFDGDLQKHSGLRSDPRALPFQVLPPSPKVLIVGSAGGHEVLASLFFGAGNITGVELNPATLALLETHFADFTGRLFENPKVTFINGDARWFMKQTDEKYDLIWFVAPDSYAAMNAAMSGAFVLSESYLYTVEMLAETYRHLTDRGVLCAQFGELSYALRPNRSTRFITTARAAWATHGIHDFYRYTLVGAGPGLPPQQDAVILVAKKPFGEEQVRRFTEYATVIERGRVLYAPNRPLDGAPTGQVITLPPVALDVWYGTYPYQVRPVYDDSPFFWHFTTFRQALGGVDTTLGGAIDFEVAIGEKFMVLLLAIVSALAAMFLLLPLALIRDVWSAMPHKPRAALYFAGIGLGFMFVEVPLIQMFTLFVGYPTRSLTVTLFALLLSSGAGSWLSARYAGERRRALPMLFAALFSLILSYRWVLPFVIEQFGGAALPIRAVLTVTLILPLGLCLGAFMPLGLSAVGSLSPHRREYVAWAWALNGFFSVVASVLATIVAMASGYSIVLLLSICAYAVASLALYTLPPTAEA